MDWGIVVAALVTAVGGIMTTLMVVLRKENTQDHAKVVDALEMLSGNVTTIGTKLDGHIDWHLKGVPNGKVSTGHQSPRTKRRVKD